MDSLKKVRKKIDKEIKTHRNNLDQEGRTIIDITVYDDNNFLSPYSSNGEETITEETATFLEHSSKLVSPKNSLHINIFSDEIDSNEKVKYKSAIKNYYFNQLIELRRLLIRNSVISLLFTIASIAIFILQFSLIDVIIDIPTLSELINIIGWVFMWEAVDQFCIERGKLNRQRYRYLNLMEAKLSFHKLKSKN